MHKKPLAGKKTATRVDRSRPPRTLKVNSSVDSRQTTTTFRQTARSVNDLLKSRQTLRQVTQALPAQQSWLQWLRERLPPELAAHVVNVVPKPVVAFGSARAGSAAHAAGELVVFADSGAWCARLRFALPAVRAALVARDSSLDSFSVRVARPSAET
jgi:uncharacterized protein (DUF2267 family)